VSREYPACRISAWHIDPSPPSFIDTDIVPTCGFFVAVIVKCVTTIAQQISLLTLHGARYYIICRVHARFVVPRCVIEWKTDNGGREAALNVTSRHATTKCNRDNSVIENTANTAQGCYWRDRRCVRGNAPVEQVIGQIFSVIHFSPTILFIAFWSPRFYTRCSCIFIKSLFTFRSISREDNEYVNEKEMYSLKLNYSEYFIDKDKD